MASIKMKGTLESADLLGFPLTLTLNESFAGSGKIKSFQKFETTIKSVSSPYQLPGNAFSSTDKKVYVYIKNTSGVAAEGINIYIKSTIPFATLNALACCTDCASDSDIVTYIQIAKLAAREYLFIPLAAQDYLYADSETGTPTLDYLVLEN